MDSLRILYFHRPFHSVSFSLLLQYIQTQVLGDKKHPWIQSRLGIFISFLNPCSFFSTIGSIEWLCWCNMASDIFISQAKKKVKPVKWTSPRNLLSLLMWTSALTCGLSQVLVYGRKESYSWTAFIVGGTQLNFPPL